MHQQDTESDTKLSSHEKELMLISKSSLAAGMGENAPEWGVRAAKGCEDPSGGSQAGSICTAQAEGRTAVKPEFVSLPPSLCLHFYI